MAVNDVASDIDAHGQRFRRFVATGDAGILDLLLHEYLDRSYAQARRLVGDANEAEDAVQEAFLRLVATAKRYDGSIPFAAWIGCLVHNASIDVLRSRAVRKRRERRYPVSQLETAEQVPTTDDHAQAVCAAVKDLPKLYRSVVDLHYFAGLSQCDTAKALGSNEVAVAKRLQRAREYLRSLLKKRGVVVASGAVLAAWSGAPAYAASASLHDSCSAATLLAADAAAPGGVGSIVAATAIKKSAIILLAFTTIAVVSWQVAGLRRRAVAFDRTWMFEPPEHMVDGISIRNGACGWAPNGGVDDSGCLAMADEHCAISFGVRADQLPIQVDFLVFPAELNRFLLTSATWFDLDTFGQFEPGIGETKLITQAGWIPMRIYVSDRSADIWCDGKRSKFAFMTAMANAELGLVTAGRCRIDQLKIRSISPSELPHDLDEFLDAAERIEPERRQGFVILPELGRADRPPPRIHYLVVHGRDQTDPANNAVSAPPLD